MAGAPASEILLRASPSDVSRGGVFGGVSKVASAWAPAVHGKALRLVDRGTYDHISSHTIMYDMCEICMICMLA